MITILMNIPQEIQSFIQQAIHISEDNLYLPYFYPKNNLNDFYYFQEHFRYEPSNSLEKMEDILLPDFKEGASKTHCYTIAQNKLGDFFYVDFSEAPKGFPVHYLPASTHTFMPTLAPTLSQFSHILLTLKDIAKHPIQAQQYVQTQIPQEGHYFWELVHESLKEEEPNADLVWGRLVIIPQGQNTLKVANYLKNKLGYDRTKSLKLAKQTTRSITIKEEYLHNLQDEITYLESLGVQVSFQAI